MPVSKKTRDSGTNPVPRRRGAFCFTRLTGMFFIVVVLLLSLAVILHRNLLEAYAPQILNTLTTELKTYYDIEFTWDGYRISGLNDFSITGTAFRDIPSNTTLLTTDSIRVRTSLINLGIRGQDPYRGVTSVELEHPVITLGCEDGRYNTGKLLEPGKGKRFKYPGRLGIIIRDGSLEWLGGEIAPGYPFPASRISGMQGVFRLGTNGSMGFSLDGTFTSSAVEPAQLSVEGAFDVVKNQTLLNIAGDNIDLTLIQPFVEKYGFNGLGGMADTSISMIFGSKAGNGFGLIGNADISDGMILTKYYDFPAHEVSGTLNFTNESIMTSGLTGIVEGSDVKVQGRMADFNLSIISTDLIINAGNLEVSTIRKIVPQISSIPMNGTVNARVELSNSVDGMDVVISADSTSVKISSLPIESGEFFGWYSDREFVVKQANINILGGVITGEGAIDSKSGATTYGFSLTASNIPSSRIIPLIPANIPPGLFPDGLMTGEMGISHDGYGMPSVNGIIRTAGATVPAYSGVGAIEASVPFEYAGNTVRITGASATAEGVSLLGEGTYTSSGGFDGSFTMAVDKLDLFERVFSIPVRGKFALAGDIWYSRASGIGMNADIVLTDGRIATIPILNATARLAYDNEGLHINGLNGLVSGGKIHGSFTIPALNSSTEGSFGTFNVDNFDFSRLLPPSYGSMLTTSLDVSGNLDYQPGQQILSIAMSIKEGAATLGPNTLTTGGDGIAARLSIPMNDIAATSITAGGILNSQPSSAPVYHGRILTPFASSVVNDIAAILAGRTNEGAGTRQASAIPPVSGSFILNLELSDLLGRQHGTVEITASPVKIAQLELASASAHIESIEGLTWNADFRVNTHEAGSFEITGQILRAANIAESTIALRAAVENSALDGLFAFLGFSGPSTSSGTLSGEGNIIGTLADPVINSFTLNLIESEVFGIPLSQGEATFSYEWPMLKITGMEVVGSDGFRALGAGTLDLISPSLTGATLVLRVDSFDLQAIARALGTDIPVAGLASGTLQLAQDALGPKILYNGKIENLAVNTSGNDLSLGLLAWSAQSRPGEPQITINNLELRKEGESIAVSGLIPAGLGKSGDNLFDLSMISETGYTIPIPDGVIAPNLSLRGGFGVVDLTLTGSVLEPILTGELGIDIRDVKFFGSTIANSVAGSLTAENSVLTASPDRMQITGDGWTLGADGHIDLNSLKMYAAQTSIGVLIANIAMVPASSGPVRIAGPGFEFQLQPDTGDNALRLRIEGKFPVLTTSISGNVRIVGGQVNIAQLPEFPQNEGEGRANVNLDVRTVVRAGIRVRNGNMFNVIFESGELNLTGSIGSPALVGSVSAPTGWIDIFGNHFVLTEPLEFTFTSIYPISNPHINATAQAYLAEIRSEADFNQEVTITAHINSRLSNMLENLDLTSDPPMTEDRIIAALAYEDVIFRTLGNTLFGDGSLGGGITDMDFGGVVLPFATSYLSRYIREEAGFSDFQLSLDENQDISIYLEKEVFDNLVMYYQQKFGAEDNYSWGARYRWRPRSWVGFEVNSDEEIIPQVQYIIPLD